MIKLCIFDLDGTLINSLPAISHFGNEALKRFGFATYEQEKYKHFVGDGAAVLIHRMLADNDTPENFKNVKTEYDRMYEADVLYSTLPYDGIPELLNSLRKNGIKTAVLSNKPHNVASEAVAQLFGDNAFDMVLGQREGIAKKPAPDGVFEILSCLNCTAEETLFIGDTNVDISTAKNAAILSVGVLWGFRDKEELQTAKADYIIDTPNEILSVALKK